MSGEWTERSRPPDGANYLGELIWMRGRSCLGTDLWRADPALIARPTSGDNLTRCGAPGPHHPNQGAISMSSELNSPSASSSVS